MIAPFSFHLPVRIRFGEGAVAALPEVLAELGATAPTVVVEAPVAELADVAAAIAGLDVYEKPPGEPTVALVDALVARMDARPPDAVVAIGGGSALDLAKAARAAHSQATPFARLLAGDVAVAEPRAGLVTVPTTSGTGSEVSGGAVVVDPPTGRKLGVASPLMRAQHALVDPLLTLGLPPAATMGTGADALAQAIGGVIVRNGNPGSVALGLEACRHVAAGLERAVADGGDRTARAELSLGSLLAGLSMNLSDCGADHALGHAIGGRMGIAARAQRRAGAGGDARRRPGRLPGAARTGRGRPLRAAGRLRRRLARGAGGAPPAGRDRLPDLRRGGRVGGRRGRPRRPCPRRLLPHGEPAHMDRRGHPPGLCRCARTRQERVILQPIGGTFCTAAGRRRGERL